MKTKIIKGTESKEINWAKVNLLKGPGGDHIVLSNGEFDFDTFSGVTLAFEGESVTGEFRTDWSKESFTLITEPITIEFNSK